MFSEFGFDLNCGLGHSGVIQLGWIPSWLVVGWNNVPLVSASIIRDGGERRGERDQEKQDVSLHSTQELKIFVRETS